MNSFCVINNERKGDSNGMTADKDKSTYKIYIACDEESYGINKSMLDHKKLCRKSKMEKLYCLLNSLNVIQLCGTISPPISQPFITKDY